MSARDNRGGVLKKNAGCPDDPGETETLWWEPKSEASLSLSHKNERERKKNPHSGGLVISDTCFLIAIHTHLHPPKKRLSGNADSLLLLTCFIAVGKGEAVLLHNNSISLNSSCSSHLELIVCHAVIKSLHLLQSKLHAYYHFVLVLLIHLQQFLRGD